MNSDQSLIATMAVLLVIMAVWLVYRPWLTEILFANNNPAPPLYPGAQSVPSKTGGTVYTA